MNEKKSGQIFSTPMKTSLYGDKYEKTFFDDKTGGYVVTEKERIKTKGKASKNDYLKYEKEKEMCKLFAKGGHSIVHLNEVSGISSSDVLFDGIKADLKRTKSPSNIFYYAKYAIRKQNAKIVLFQFDGWNSRFNAEIKNLQKENIHGYFIITGKNEIIKY